MPFRREIDTRKANKPPPRVRDTHGKKQLYKVVTSDLDGRVSGWWRNWFFYVSQPNHKGESGWNIHHGPLEVGSSGFHITTEPKAFACGINERIFEIEYKGVIVKPIHTVLYRDALVVAQFRFTREVWPSAKTKSGMSRRKPK